MQCILLIIKYLRFSCIFWKNSVYFYCVYQIKAVPLHRKPKGTQYNTDNTYRQTGESIEMMRATAKCLAGRSSWWYRGETTTTTTRKGRKQARGQTTLPFRDKGRVSHQHRCEKWKGSICVALPHKGKGNVMTPTKHICKCGCLKKYEKQKYFKRVKR